MKPFNILLISLSGILILINFLFLTLYEPEIHRWGRVISTLSFLAFFLKDFHSRKYLLLGIFILFLSADLVALNYQNISMQQTFFVFQSLAYTLLLIRIGKYLIRPKLKLYQKLYFSLVFILNTAFVIMIGGLLAEEVQNSILQFLFYMYGFSAVFFISGGILYYDHFPNYLSTAFLFAVAGLVLSNLMGFSAHFLGFSEFFYIDRFFYVVGMAGLVAYSYYFDSLPSSAYGRKFENTKKNFSGRSASHEVIEQREEEHEYL